MFSQATKSSNTTTGVKRTKVFVGLSGGVDSAVSASLLIQQGYDVHGVYIKVWQPDWIDCNWKDERRDAMRVAAHLDIPFYTLDAVDAYKHGVIDYMISEYSHGRTPNPDVMCNREVKFGVFWKWARSMGADYIATGHYTRIIKGEADRPRLLKGADESKDQSYFLWTLTEGDLKHIIFPIGHLLKSEVRAHAHKIGLPNADKKDSQGLCFIGKIDIKDFLRRYIVAKDGNVVNESGEIIGKHPGAVLFTIGERHGFTINHESNNDAPYYVVGKDIKQNTLTVTNCASSNMTAKSKKKVKLVRTNWISEPSRIENPLIRTRYRQRLVRGEIHNNIVTLLEPISDIAIGQSLVVYDGEVCVGGGIIDSLL